MDRLLSAVADATDEYTALMGRIEELESEAAELRDRMPACEVEDTNSEEFFAEAFANSKSGSPNGVGKAMNDYLRNRKL